MSKHKIFYYIGVMLLISSLLMIVANNVPILASFRWLWAPVFLVFSFVEYLQSYNKQVLYSLIYGLLYAGILQYTLWAYATDWYKHAIFEDFYAMVVVVIFHVILKNNYMIKNWIKLAKLGFISIIITGIMTIVATNINPMVVRASYSNLKYNLPGYLILERLGFGSYGYMAALIALIPILYFFIQRKTKIWFSRHMWIALLIFFLFVLIRSQIFANILIAAVILFLSISGVKKFKRNIFITLLFLFVFYSIPVKVWVNLFIDIGNFFSPITVLHNKFIDLASFIDNPNIYSSNTGIAYRANRYPLLFQAFLSRPFLGDASYNSAYEYALAAGGHLYWMSRLTLWGIFGFAGYIVILYKVFVPVLKMFNEEFRFYYFLSLLGVIILGFLKNLGGREPYIMLLIIIPGLYYLYYQTQNIPYRGRNVD
ncbi:hypothetical protein Calab_0567 [Caldithrix abyssi DSM 13497]|uniref:O-antigen ligase like membrane protein n=1 Tax=Caldithrix abyssi DSM 13497 TaxID=880073 RepID=H1XS46_CALAY|nr:hypothetical protein [Caldithrix abyssi]APF20149.1 hypothetical protein Cabys_3401 [Caldithrix abyssi DSM 13497]EHO40210.1 hypothetical protein Calab_0567 [Caldithrix abyssi DSM 13497]